MDHILNAIKRMEPGDEVECDRAYVTIDRVYVRRPDQTLIELRPVMWNEPDKAEIERLRAALETIAAQDSGIIGSTAKADCMAAIAQAALRYGREQTPQEDK